MGYLAKYCSVLPHFRCNDIYWYVNDSYKNDINQVSGWWDMTEWWWKIGFTPRAIRQFCRDWQHSSLGAISSYLWELSLIVASPGHHTQFTFQKYPCLGPQMTTSDNAPSVQPTCMQCLELNLDPTGLHRSGCCGLHYAMDAKAHNLPPWEYSRRKGFSWGSHGGSSRQGVARIRDCVLRLILVLKFHIYETECVDRRVAPGPGKLGRPRGPYF